MMIFLRFGRHGDRSGPEPVEPQRSGSGSWWDKDGATVGFDRYVVLGGGVTWLEGSGKTYGFQRFIVPARIATHTARFRDFHLQFSAGVLYPPLAAPRGLPKPQGSLV